MNKIEKDILRKLVEHPIGLLSSTDFINGIAEHNRKAIVNLVTMGYVDEVPQDVKGIKSGSAYSLNFYRASERGMAYFGPWYKRLWFEFKRNSTPIIGVFTIIVSIITLSVSVRLADISDRSFQIAQRPYLIVDSMSIDKPPDKSHKTKATIILKNAGVTPVLDMQSSTHIDLFGTAPSVVADDILEWYDLITIGANDTREISIYSERILSDIELADVNSGKLKIFVTGIVRYKDIFKKIHKTTFCGYYIPTTNQGPNYLFACPKFNSVE